MKLSPPPQGPGSIQRPPSASLDSLKVLVVEDLRPQQQVIERLLGKLGCSTTIAGDMRLALEYARYRHFHAVLIDSLVPDIAGASSVAAIRQVSAALGRPVYVVAMCGTAHCRPQAEQLKQAADAQLRKPLRVDALHRCLAHLTPPPTVEARPGGRDAVVMAPSAPSPVVADTSADEPRRPLRVVLAHVDASAWNDASTALANQLGDQALDLQCVMVREELEHRLREGSVDVLLGDHALVQAIPADAAKELTSTPWIALAGDLATAHAAMAAGAADFALAPYAWDALALRIQRLRVAQAQLAELHQYRDRLLMMQRVARVGEWALDPASGELRLSTQARQLLRLGQRQDERFTQQDLLRRIHPNDRERCARTLRAVAERSTAMECEFQLATGDVWLAQHIVPVRTGGAAVRLRGTLQDVSARRAQEQEIRRLAYYDDVTGLPNRRHFREQLGRALDRATVNESSLAVLFIDLDEFKRINDTLGHTFGDLLLRQVADRLAAVVRESDAIGHSSTSAPQACADEGDRLDEVARMGGDEFVVLLTQLPEGQDAAGVAARIVNVLNRPIVVDGHDMRVTPSIGIALYPRDGQDVETLLRCADTAMYHAKSLGRNRFEFFSEELGERALRRLTLEGRLRVALRANEFSLAYQPKIALSSGRCVGVEALIRWEREGKTQMAPVDFLPVAESSGLIIDGEWVLAEVLRQLDEWATTGVDVPRVTVNTSVIQFNRGKFCEVLSYVSEPKGLLQRLELDLTEHALMSISDSAISDLADLRARGLRVAVDDFGTGYSSLQNLRRLPLDALKVDRSFVDGLPTQTGDQAIVSAIISLGQQLGLEVVGEGVETEAQREWLAAHGCDTIQGFLISHPVRGAAIAELLTDQPQVQAS
ncbi:MAG: EAL domain-containing protein [Pseudomonadota bacterium]